jgi:hypothetical protein
MRIPDRRYQFRHYVDEPELMEGGYVLAKPLPEGSVVRAVIHCPTAGCKGLVQGMAFYGEFLPSGISRNVTQPACCDACLALRRLKQ